MKITGEITLSSYSSNCYPGSKPAVRFQECGQKMVDICIDDFVCNQAIIKVLGGLVMQLWVRGKGGQGGGG